MFNFLRLVGSTKLNISYKNITYFAIFLCILITLKYHFRFNENRKFHELANVDLSNVEVNFENFFKGLRWVTQILRTQKLSLKL